jgi:thiamine kinase-like enzyme
MDLVQQVIAQVPAWQGAREIRVERIAGLTNTNYCITVDGERFVLRLSGKNTDRLGINRAHEHAALRAAAAAGIGPEVFVFLPPEGHLATRWIEGRHWDVSEFRTSERVRLLTDTVKRIHHLLPNGAVFSPFQRVTAFLETVREFRPMQKGRNDVILPPGLETFLATMQAIEADQQYDLSDWRLFCHNDLVAVNYLFLERDQSIKVLDWEFAGLGDIYYDLATVVYTHDSEGPIPPHLEELMLACYFGNVTNFQRRRLMGMKYMLMLFTGAWGLAQHSMQQAGLIPAVEGFDYLEFAKHLFAHDIYDLQGQYNRMAECASSPTSEEQ